MGYRRCVALVLLAFALFGFGTARAETLTIAVAANFKAPIDALKPAFERASGHELRVASGSTGKLYAQIEQGAPFALLLAADQERPALLVEEGLALPESRFTYAIGKLALWSPQARYDQDTVLLEALQRLDFRRLAIANPALAPYGLAAEQSLAALDLLEALEGRIVMGQNIGQTYALVATENAELGFVALSSLRQDEGEAPRHVWEVPETLHQPIRQDAVLLTAAKDDEAAKDFLAFMQSAEARGIIESFGYRTD